MKAEISPSPSRQVGGMQRFRLLVLAQTPPPAHGQSLMQQYLVSADWTWCSMTHVRLRFSRDLEEIGRFSVRKILHLFAVVSRCWRARLSGPFDILYYPPAGPNRIPFLRDVVTLILTRWTARRLVLHCHAGGLDRLQAGLSRPEKMLARVAYGNAALAIVPASLQQGEVEWLCPRSIVTIANGVPDVPPHPVDPGSAPRRTILFVGSLTREKGVMVLLQAVRRLADAGRRPDAVLAGGFRSSRFRNEVLAYIDAGGLGSAVRLAGILGQEDLRTEYERAGIFCFPTEEAEGMPSVLLEAMRAALPIVTTRWRSIPEIVGPAAVLVPPGDPAALSTALGTLLDADEQRRALGREGRKRYEMHFTLTRHLAQMEKALLRVAAS